MADNDQLTEIEREAIEEDTAAPVQAPDIEAEGETAEDRPWLDDARQQMREFLTDEELAALSEDDDEAEDEDESEAATDQAEPTGADDVQQNETQAEPDEAPEPEQAKAKLAPELTAEELAEIQAQTQAEIDKLDDLYDDGELTREELRARRRDVLSAEKDAISARQEAKASEIAEQQASAFQESHRAAAKVFFAKNTALTQDNDVLQRFDVLQQQVQVDPKFQGKTSAAIFEEAKQRLVDEARREGRTIAGLTSSPKRPRHATRDVPPTVRNIPATAPNAPEGSELAQVANRIMNADPVTAEKLMARLTPDQQDRILQGDF